MRYNKSDISKYEIWRNEKYDLYDVPTEHYNKTSIYFRRNGDYGDYILKSYETIVAEYYKGQLYVYGWYSMTTARHINTFLNMMGFDSMNKKQMEEYINPDARNTCKW